MNIEELERLAKAATPGPWQVDLPNAHVTNGDYTIAEADAGGPNGGSYSRGFAMSQANARYLAACNPSTILRLLAVVKAAKQYLREDNGTEATPGWRAFRNALDQLDKGSP